MGRDRRSAVEEPPGPHTRILNLIFSLGRGGKERQLATICNNLDRSEYASKIVYFKEAQADYLDQYRLREIATRVAPDGKLRMLSSLRGIADEFEPDVIYAWGAEEAVLGMLLARTCGAKLINGSIRHGIRIRRVNQFTRMLLLHLTRHVVANSRAGLKANHLRRGHVLYNGVGPEFSEIPDAGSRDALRESILGVRTPSPVLLSVANLVPYKDYFTVLDSLRSLLDESYDFLYLIAGEGPLRERLDDAVERHGLVERVRFLGSVDNVQDFLAIADVFVHSSRGEGCSNAILEAMHKGLPIVASDTGGTSEIVEPGNGFLFEYRDRAGLATRLRTLLDDPDLRSRMGRASHAIATSRFTVERMLRDYAGILEQVLGRG